MLPTIKAVAEAAGVSTATVSRVLNSVDVVSPTTRTRVLLAVERCGYVPNEHARQLSRTSRSPSPPA